MLKWRRFDLFCLLLTLTLTVGAAAQTGSAESDVTDFGRDRWRTHNTPLEPEFPVDRDAQAIWEVPLGLSRSQPLVVRRDFDGDGRLDLRIFHLAGDSLWALDGEKSPSPRRPSQDLYSYWEQLRQEGFILWSRPADDLCRLGDLRMADPLLNLKCNRLKPRVESRPFASSQVTYFKSSHPDQDLLYVGFGHPASVVAIRPTNGHVLGGYIVDAGTDRGIVGAPLVFAPDTVVIGTTAGEAFIIKGLASGTATARGYALGGRISSSPVPYGETGFIMATDAAWNSTLGTHGRISAYSLAYGEIQEFAPRWPATVITPKGIPGEVAIDARTVYFADKTGRLYSLDLENGELLWCRQYPGMEPCQPYDRSQPPNQPAFINNGPGVDENYVYFVFRNNQGANQGNGHVVSLQKATGKLVWQRSMIFKGNTAPVPMGQILLVGDTGGYVRAFSKETGRPIEYGGYPLHLSNEPYVEGTQGEQWWEPIGGTATQMTIASGLMLVGVNSTSAERTILKAYRLHRLPDLTLTRLDAPAEGSFNGVTAEVRAVCRGCEKSTRAVLSFQVNGMEVPRKVVTLHKENNYGATLTFWTGPLPSGASVRLTAIIDPDDLVDESDEGNNRLETWMPVPAPQGIYNTDGWGSKLTD